MIFGSLGYHFEVILSPKIRLGCFGTSNWRPEVSWGPLGGAAENLKALWKRPRGLGAFPDRAPEGSLKCILDVWSVQKHRKVGT